MYYEDQTPAEKATERVATLIGDDFETTNLFCQMDVMRHFKDDFVWQEMARWVRYEEAVEEGGQRWSKPHVASLMMEALQDLQDILITCPIILDCKATLMSDIVDTVLDHWIRDRSFNVMLRNHFRSILLKPHKFQHYTKKDTKSVKRKPTSLKLKEAYINGGYNSDKLYGVTQYCPESPSLALGSQNTSFMKKIPQGAEAVNLMIGEVEELERTVAAFIRLKKPSNVGDITEVDIDTKFIFIILGPKDYLGHCAEIGRCMAALFTDEIFRSVAFRARDRGDILAGVHEFSLHLTVLPPGTWDPTTRIEPPEEIPSQEHRKTMTTSKSAVSLSGMDNNSLDAEGEEPHGDPTLVRTGRLFGGLIDDVKRKLPHYASDFKDAFHVQCVASFCFLFLATLTPNVTFGGLLGQATDDYMGAMECILSASLSGVLYALFAGQPLNILGSTGPMLVLEGILYRFCKDQDWDFMPFRVWVGLWTAFMILLIVAFDLSALVRFITRFTEESFACLIALIFIYQAFKNTFGIAKEAKVHLHPNEESRGCFCIMANSSYISMRDLTYLNQSTSFNQTQNETEDSFSSDCTLFGGKLVGDGCSDTYTPDVFFFSLLLFFGTYILATSLVHFRHSLFFPTWVRTNVSDFAVITSIAIMVCLDSFLGIPTPKLTVPTEFKPTKPGRSWLINPISDKNPWWLIILSVLPAFLATILIFMDQQITAVIVNRRENKLKKGSGYHLDLLVVGVLVVLLSFFGLPWYVAATVTALAHIMSLKKVSECTAPGERPVFLGVREQRVTALLVGIFSGMAIFFTSVLRLIPMPVLYGVFLFMGVAPLNGMQLVQRVLLIFMPAKYQPDYSYIRNVPIKRVHIFTAIQTLCLALLWVIKSIKSISIGFPLMVLILCFVRKGMDKLFTQRELKWLDDILPATEVKQGEEEEEEDDEGEAKPPPKKKQPVPIKIQIDEPKTDSRSPSPTFYELSQPSARSGGDPDDRKSTDELEEPFKNVLIPRMSLTFMLRSDLDQLKAKAPPELCVDRRKSLALAVERKKSAQEGRPLVGLQRKISGHSLLDGRRSHDGSLLDMYHNTGPSYVEEHNKLNRLLSMPATIADEDETNESTDQSEQPKK